jgi:hypothetical protein
VCIRPARIYDSVTTVCAKAFITYVIVNVPAPNAVVADVFGTGISQTSRAIKQDLASYHEPPFSFVFPQFLKQL